MTVKLNTSFSSFHEKSNVSEDTLIFHAPSNHLKSDSEYSSAIQVEQLKITKSTSFLTASFIDLFFIYSQNSSVNFEILLRDIIKIVKIQNRKGHRLVSEHSELVCE